MHPFRIIDTTLREGEQCACAHFGLEDKLALARAVDAFGVDYLELTSPAASPRARAHFERVVELGLRTRVVAHCRCVVADVQAAIDAGATGVGLFFATSRVLREASHGRNVQQTIDVIGPPLERAIGAGLETRFSAEDAFRTDDAELLEVYRAVAALGVHRVGLADTVGIATPSEVRRRVARVREAVRCDIGFHGHNDTGCAVANAYEAIAAGATHVDVSVLGIGERVGITPLGAFVARMLSVAPDRVVGRYRLEQLAALERQVAEAMGVQIPFNNCVTGEVAFSHKAGTHLKAMLQDPTSYEAVSPELFGERRTFIVGSHLTGRHAVAHRARALGLQLDAQQAQAITLRIKQLADQHDLSDEEVDRVLREWVLA
ncbi:MAG: homocitrate synthase [Polyangiaceae bacterium]|nr:homocitrate synthase [Polyangiaceae bacterium]